LWLILAIVAVGVVVVVAIVVAVVVLIKLGVFASTPTYSAAGIRSAYHLETEQFLSRADM